VALEGAKAATAAAEEAVVNAQAERDALAQAKAGSEEAGAALASQMAAAEAQSHALKQQMDLLQSQVHSQTPIAYSSSGMFCAVPSVFVWRCRQMGEGEGRLNKCWMMYRSF
jgi:hypothetical protein